jgi:hypothetical protein
MQSTCPGEGAGVGAPEIRPPTSGLRPYRGKHPSRCSVSFLGDSSLATSLHRVPGDHGRMGTPRD